MTTCGHLTFPSTRIYNVFRKILGSPHVASLVRTVRFGYDIPSKYWTVPQLTAPEVKLAQRVIYDLHIPSADLWIHRLESGDNFSLDAALACVFYSLPCLEALELNTPFHDRTTIPIDMFQCILRANLTSSLPSAFRTLRRISYFTDFQPSHNGLRPCFSYFLNLLYLPVIETVKAVVLETPANLEWPAGLPCASTLTALHLCRSQVTEETLSQLLSATPNLKIFEYDFLCDMDYTTPCRDYLDCTALRRSLQLIKTSLETLIISVEFLPGINAPDESPARVQGNLGCLNNLSKLRSLTVPMVVLLGWDPDTEMRLASNLPSELRYFCCGGNFRRWDTWAWPDDAIIGQFQEYIDADTSLELEDLRLRARGMSRGMSSLWTEKVTRSVKASCVDNGVWYEHDDD